MASENTHWVNDTIVLTETIKCLRCPNTETITGKVELVNGSYCRVFSTPTGWDGEIVRVGTYESPAIVNYFCPSCTTKEEMTVDEIIAALLAPVTK